MARRIRFKWTTECTCRWFVWEPRTGICSAKLSSAGISVRVSTVAESVHLSTRGLTYRLTTAFPDGTQCRGMPSDSVRAQREHRRRRDDAIRVEAYAAGQDVGDFVAEVLEVSGSPLHCEIHPYEQH